MTGGMCMKNDRTFTVTDGIWMKNGRMKGLFFLLIFFLVMPGTQAYGASKRTKALLAYRQFLSGQTIPVKHEEENTRIKPEACAFMTLDNDSVPELAVAGPGAWYYLFCYRNGKVEQVGKTGIYASWGLRYYAGRSVLSASGFAGVGSSAEYHYKMNAGKTKLILKAGFVSGMNFREWYLGKRKVSQKVYETEIGKMTAGYCKRQGRAAGKVAVFHPLRPRFSI